LKLNKYKIFLSLSDENKHSIAYVIINKQTWLKNL
jgi:phosphopantetheinyl transferase (holo-ACP synthase)